MADVVSWQVAENFLKKKKKKKISKIFLYETRRERYLFLVPE